MARLYRHEVLIVDDDAAIRDIFTLMLQRAGYEVRSAVDGFDALACLKAKVPDLLISDLEMPQMSGFELLSVVRRRFPQIPVMAMSGAYHSDCAIPGGVIADCFYDKGQGSPQDLLKMVAGLAANAASHAQDHERRSAPVWIPRNGNNVQGVSHVMVNCTECLRSFPLQVAKEHLHKIQDTTCLFCHSSVQYVIDISLRAASPQPLGDV